MVDWIDWNRVATAVEVGPGTGAFTGAVLGRMRPACRYLAVDSNPTMCEILLKRFPGLPVYCDSASNLPAICARDGIDSVDAVICGLPWAAFPEEVQRACMEGILAVLRKGGAFATFAYVQGLMLPAGRRFRVSLRERFTEVRTSRIVWLNMPPAFVYRCVR